jgi:glycosyltransferase involved in cell wall biosynthesis
MSNGFPIKKYSPKPRASLKEPLVAILMCTYNGERFLSEQLKSIENQTHKNIVLWVSDDGSDDQTMAILEDYQKRWGKERVHILEGPRKGLITNFMRLICCEDIKTKYYAYADQDDIWVPTKLSHALSVLSKEIVTIPQLYCSRASLIDQDGNLIGYTPLFARSPHFKNALVQSIAGGNTMVLNHAAISILRQAGQLEVPCHDWWTYLIVSGAGGQVHYDPEPTVLYRQHEKNEIGANISWLARLKRAYALYQGRFTQWGTMNEFAIDNSRFLLTPENNSVFNLYVKARHDHFFNRLISLKKSGIYRQNIGSNISLLIAIALRKI